MIELRELPVVEESVNSDGLLSYDAFKIIHQPRMVLSGVQQKKNQSANRLFATADKGCVVGNLLKKLMLILNFKKKSLLNKLAHYLNSSKLEIIKGP